MGSRGYLGVNVDEAGCAGGNHVDAADRGRLITSSYGPQDDARWAPPAGLGRLDVDHECGSGTSLRKVASAAPSIGGALWMRSELAGGACPRVSGAIGCCGTSVRRVVVWMHELALRACEGGSGQQDQREHVWQKHGDGQRRVAAPREGRKKDGGDISRLSRLSRLSMVSMVSKPPGRPCVQAIRQGRAEQCLKVAKLQEI